MSDYPQGSRDIIRLQFGTFSFLFFLFLEKRASYLYKHQLDYSGLFFFFYLWREHALQSGKHASYTGNEHGATNPAV